LIDFVVVLAKKVRKKFVERHTTSEGLHYEYNVSY